MHYVDEGEGPTIVFVHGNPGWSFEFRELIKDLRADHRCIAMDHIGFGLSSRSQLRHDYDPRTHAARFTALLDHLEVKEAVLFLSDWGGPIGLDFARRQPHRVSRLIVTNTWCWPVNRDPYYIFFSTMMRSPLGQFLIKRFNFFVNGIMTRAMGKASKVPSEVMDHYRNAQPAPAERAACAAFPGHILSSTQWLGSIWADRAAFSSKPSLILWGLQDIAFRRKELERWKLTLSDSRPHEFSDVGHFIAEEGPARILPLVREFLA